MNEMTMRERMLAFIQGHEHDRVPFVQYSGCAGPDGEIWDLIGRESMGLLRWTTVRPRILSSPGPRCSTSRHRISRPCWPPGG